MKNLRLLPLAFALAGAYAAPASAQSLQELYLAASTYDAAYQSANAQYRASMAVVDAAKANLLPTVGLSASGSTGQVNIFDSTPAQNNRNFNGLSTTLSASHPLYRPVNAVQYQQGLKQAQVAQAVIAAAEQDLIVRTSQAYFDVLGAQDTLAFVRAQKVAVGEQLASAKRNFEVGTATITDTREAQARFDLVLAQEIAADNDLRVKGLALDGVVGKTKLVPKALATTALPALLPADADLWVQQALDNHPAIKQLEAAYEVAQLEVQKAQAGHKPTLDLTASYGYSDNSNGTAVSSASSKTTTGVLGVSFNLPLFAGFLTQNRIKETLALADKVRNDLEASKRNVSQATRSAYFGVLSGMGQVKALEAAEASSQSALEANKLGYQVGVRINIDVLNSQSQLFQTKRDLAKARYDVLVGSLKLRQANGTLKAPDVAGINGLLVK